HGSKGLEGEIVFLIDAHRTPDPKNLGPVFDAETGPLHAGGTRVPLLLRDKSVGGARGDAIRADSKRADYEEYRRLLYVAATRARDQLYICGVERRNASDPRNKPTAEQSWHALSAAAFERIEGRQTSPHAAWDGDVQTLSSAQEDDCDPAQTSFMSVQQETPTWLTRAAAPEAGLRTLSPSRLADDEEAQSEPAAYSPAAGQDRFFRGRILHALLQHLPTVAPDRRAQAADAYLARTATMIAPDERARWRDEILAVFMTPSFAAAFAPESRAEVSVVGTPPGLGDDFVISGQIDRLAVTDEAVLIVDYKTNRPPPARPEDAGEAYLAQMAAYRALMREIYPGQRIKSALLWTFEARLMELPDALLDHAFARSMR
ncbi:MAG: PD-(D/E)XK nuclease family protein, partial [Pseudomonadota bacterium]